MAPSSGVRGSRAVRAEGQRKGGREEGGDGAEGRRASAHSSGWRAEKEVKPPLSRSGVLPSSSAAARTRRTGWSGGRSSASIVPSSYTNTSLTSLKRRPASSVRDVWRRISRRLRPRRSETLRLTAERM